MDWYEKGRMGSKSAKPEQLIALINLEDAIKTVLL